MKRRIISFSITVFIIVVTAALIIGLAFAIYVAATMESEIDESLFEVLGGHTASKIYYYESDGKRDVGEATELEDQELYGGYRSLPLKYEEVPSDLINAFVSIEDRRFFSHKGVDWKRTLGASANYFRHIP